MLVELPRSSDVTTLPSFCTSVEGHQEAAWELLNIWSQQIDALLHIYSIRHLKHLKCRDNKVVVLNVISLLCFYLVVVVNNNMVYLVLVVNTPSVPK